MRVSAHQQFDGHRLLIYSSNSPSFFSPPKYESTWNSRISSYSLNILQMIINFDKYRNMLSNYILNSFWLYKYLSFIPYIGINHLVRKTLEPFPPLLNPLFIPTLVFRFSSLNVFSYKNIFPLFNPLSFKCGGDFTLVSFVIWLNKVVMRLYTRAR